MKVVIRHPKATLYWTGSSSWTNDPKKAMVFLDEARAVNHAFWHDLELFNAVALQDNARQRKKPLKAQKS